MRISALYIPVSVLPLVLLAACATIQTPYRDVPAAQLSDEQLLDELASTLQGLGMQFNRTAYLMAVRPDPAYVLTSSTTRFSGTANTTVNAYSMPVGYGIQTTGTARSTITGTATTQYQYVDANAYARLGNAIALAISRAREQAYRERGQKVYAELERRVAARRAETERIIQSFFTENPELDDRRLLVAAVAPWVAAEGTEQRAILEETKDVIHRMRRGGGLTGDWYGTISQVTEFSSGETAAFSQFVRMELTDEDGMIRGQGVLGTGEQIEMEGRLDGQRIEAAVANTTSAINVTLTGIVTSTQITAEYEGYGAGQQLAGTAVLVR